MRSDLNVHDSPKVISTIKVSIASIGVPNCQSKAKAFLTEEEGRGQRGVTCTYTDLHGKKGGAERGHITAV